jgi:alcohol dehydrogenase class IV
MFNFEFSNSVKVLFGRGKTAQVGKAAAQYGKKAMVVTYNDPNLKALLNRVLSYLSEDGIEYVVFDKAQANPLTTTAMEGAAFAQAEGCDVIIGLGGGSAMDTAKGIAFLAVNPGEISDYIFGKPGNGALPLILITTTAGTGSEGNGTAVFTNPVTNDKKGLVSPYIFPKISIVDPELMTTLPKRIIAGPGLDVLFHAIESYISKKSHPVSEMLSLKAITMVSKYLPKVYDDPSDLDSWDNVALANTLAGMAIGYAGTTLPHAMEHPLSGLLNIVHSEGLAALYIAFMEFTYKSAPEKFANIASAMGEDISGLSVEEAAAKSIDSMRRIMEHVNLNPNLTKLGVKEEHIDWLANNTLTLMRLVLENNPIVPNSDEVKEIYRKCL